MDLHVEPVAGGRRAGLEQALRDAIRAGRLAPGTRLPASRALAGDLGLSRGTVTGAYTQLTAEGYLVARQGAGTRVAHRVGAPPAVPPGPAPARPPIRYDLRPGMPDVTAFPRRDWLAASRSVLDRPAGDTLGFGDPRGTATLRAELAGYLGRVRGVQTTPGLLMICNGFAHGLSLLCTALLERGIRTLAVEDPCLPIYPQLARDVGLRVVPIPVDEHGMRTDLLAGTDARAALVTPAHQFPVGVPMSARRRALLVDWARGVDGVVIEDDYDGEFRYDRQPVGALQGLAADRVGYAGTVSKTLAPGLRLGWLAVPPTLLDALVAIRRRTDRYSGTFDQLVLAELLRGGAYDRHVRRSRTRYRRRRDALCAALPSRYPVSGIAAGLQALVTLPPGRTEAELLAEADRRSIGLDALGPHYRRPGPHPQQLIVAYGTPAEHAFGPALRALTELLT